MCLKSECKCNFDVPNVVWGDELVRGRKLVDIIDELKQVFIRGDIIPYCDQILGNFNSTLYLTIKDERLLPFWEHVIYGHFDTANHGYESSFTFKKHQIVDELGRAMTRSSLHPFDLLLGYHCSQQMKQYYTSFKAFNGAMLLLEKGEIKEGLQLLLRSAINLQKIEAGRIDLLGYKKLVEWVHKKEGLTGEYSKQFNKYFLKDLIGSGALEASDKLAHWVKKASPMYKSYDSKTGLGMENLAKQFDQAELVGLINWVATEMKLDDAASAKLLSHVNIHPHKSDAFILSARYGLLAEWVEKNTSLRDDFKSESLRRFTRKMAHWLIDQVKPTGKVLEDFWRDFEAEIQKYDPFSADRFMQYWVSCHVGYYNDFLDQLDQENIYSEHFGSLLQISKLLDYNNRGVIKYLEVNNLAFNDVINLASSYTEPLALSRDARFEHELIPQYYAEIVRCISLIRRDALNRLKLGVAVGDFECIRLLHFEYWAVMPSPKRMMEPHNYTGALDISKEPEDIISLMGENAYRAIASNQALGVLLAAHVDWIKADYYLEEAGGPLPRMAREFSMGGCGMFSLKPLNLNQLVEINTRLNDQHQQVVTEVCQRAQSENYRTSLAARIETIKALAYFKMLMPYLGQIIHNGLKGIDENIITLYPASASKLDEAMKYHKACMINICEFGGEWLYEFAVKSGQDIVLQTFAQYDGNANSLAITTH